MEVLWEGKVTLDSLCPPVNPRRLSVAEDDITTMATSMAQVGQLQAIVIREPGPPWEIVIGHCRCLAARRLGWTALDARRVIVSDAEVFWMRCHENGKRIPLTAQERVKEACEAVDACGGDIGFAAFKLGVTRGTVDDWLAVVSWPEDVREVLYEGQISRAAAQWLARVTADAERGYMLRQAVEHGYGERITKHWFHDWRVSGMVRAEGAHVGGPGSTAVPVPDPVRPCDFCGELRSFADLHGLFIDDGCRAVIIANRPGAEGAPVESSRVAD